MFNFNILPFQDLILEMFCLYVIHSRSGNEYHEKFEIDRTIIIFQKLTKWVTYVQTLIAENLSLRNLLHKQMFHSCFDSIHNVS